jgi:hypothetical protein
MKRFLIAAGLLVSAATPAMATPFVDISTYWRAYLPFGTPAGISITCENGATPLATGGQPGCIDFFSLDKTVTTSGTLSASQTAYVGITNNTGALELTPAAISASTTQRPRALALRVPLRAPASKAPTRARSEVPMVPLMRGENAQTVSAQPT